MHQCFIKLSIFASNNKKITFGKKTEKVQNQKFQIDYTSIILGDFHNIKKL